MRAYMNFPASPDNATQRREHYFQRPCRTLEALSVAEVPAILEEAEALSRAGAWVVGFVTYEAAPAFEPLLRCHAPAAALPLAFFMVFSTTAPAFEEGDYACGPWLPSEEEPRVQQNMGLVREDILNGEYYQINYTTRIKGWTEGDRFALFRTLQRSQPRGYCLFMETANWSVLSVSPELFFTWEPGGLLTTKPMKGTAARGTTPDADRNNAQALRNSEKERAENLMIVDLLRNDLSVIAQTRTVSVPTLFEIEALPTVWQMTTTVQCAPLPTTTLAGIFKALFPCGSITGAPKQAAMAAIERFEPEARGAYCGAIGVLAPGGATTFNVGIRTVVVDKAGNAQCGVGSGVTLLSEGKAEYQEWLLKSRFLEPTSPLELLATMRLEAGQIYLKAAHLARLVSAVRKLGFPFSEESLAAELACLEACRPAGAWRVRLVLKREGALAAEIAPLVLQPLVRFRIARRAISAGNPGLYLKTTRRALYESLERPFGGKEVLMHNEQGELTEFTRGNLVLELDGHLVTPPVSCGLLPGVLRQSLLDDGTLQERVLPLEILPQATKVWLINSVRGWQRVEAAR